MMVQMMSIGDEGHAVPVLWSGCWEKKEDGIAIGFEDGDYKVMKAEQFMWFKDPAGI
jgi:hypothetical protein